MTGNFIHKSGSHLSGPYINDPGYFVPENNILVVPHFHEHDGYWTEVIEPLVGKIKRDWFDPHFYYCLPLSIGNQYGFLIKSLRDLDIYWPGGESPVTIDYLNNDNAHKQFFKPDFQYGILTVQNAFALKTPPGINLMTIQPPNLFIPGCASMTGVIECDNIRRDFTFNIKITVPNMKISIRKGDPVGAFIPIQRHFVENFEVKLVTDVFDKEFELREQNNAFALGWERDILDKNKTRGVGRRYYNGFHPTDEAYVEHQKKIKKTDI